MMRVLRILAVSVLFGCSVAFAQGPPQAAKVVVSKVTQQEVSENRPFIGVLYYDRVSRVSSEVSGLVEKVDVKEGDRVNMGTPLLRINTELLDKDIALSRGRVEQIQLRIEYAEKNYKRLEAIYSKNGVSERDYEEALHTYQDLVKEKQILTEALEKLLIQKRKSVIRAPFDGVVLEKNIDSGDWVQQGKHLVSIGSTKDLFVKVPIAETLLQFVTLGETATVTIHAFNKEITGTIMDFDPIADEKTKNVFLKVRIPKVAENMSATVFVPTSGKRQLRIIPRDALVKFQGKDFVYVVKEGKAEMKPVNIVTFLGNKIGVDNPYVAAGMSVVVEGNERLRPDQAVHVVGEK